MLLEKITDSVSWFFTITVAKIMTFSAPRCPISGLFRTSGNPGILTHSNALQNTSYKLLRSTGF